MIICQYFEPLIEREYRMIVSLAYTVKVQSVFLKIPIHHSLCFRVFTKIISCFFNVCSTTPVMMSSQHSVSCPVLIDHPDHHHSPQRCSSFIIHHCLTVDLINQGMEDQENSSDTSGESMEAGDDGERRISFSRSSTIETAETTLSR